MNEQQQFDPAYALGGCRGILMAFLFEAGAIVVGIVIAAIIIIVKNW